MKFMLIWFYDYFLIHRHHPPPSSSSRSICTRCYRNASTGCAAPNLSQNMFFTGTTTIPLDVMHQNHQSVMTQNRTPPTLFQYPSKSFIAMFSACLRFLDTIDGFKKQTRLSSRCRLRLQSCFLILLKLNLLCWCFVDVQTVNYVV